MDVDKEHEHLLGMLKIYASEINGTWKKYRASVDKSGAIPQLIISEN